MLPQPQTSLINEITAYYGRFSTQNLADSTLGNLAVLFEALTIEDLETLDTPPVILHGVVQDMVKSQQVTQLQSFITYVKKVLEQSYMLSDTSKQFYFLFCFVLAWMSLTSSPQFYKLYALFFQCFNYSKVLERL